MPKRRGQDHTAQCFGLMLGRLRAQRGWTLADVARASGMHATYLGILEDGRNTPSLNTLFKLADVFGIDVLDFVREIAADRKARQRTQ